MDSIRSSLAAAPLVLLAALALGPGAAQAVPSTRAQACGADFTGTCPTLTGGLDVTATSSGSSSPEPTGTDFWDVTAAAEIGALHVSATATSVGTFSFTPPYAVASGYARFDDTLTFIAAGDVTEPIAVTFVLALDGACSGSSGSVNGFATSGCTAQARLFGPPQLFLGMQVGGAESTTFAWETNAALGIAGDLSVSGFATDGFFDGEFGDTGRVFAFTTTPGVTLVSASGHDYALQAAATPLPEAPSIALVGAGLALLARHRRGSRAGRAAARVRPRHHRERPHRAARPLQ